MKTSLLTLAAALSLALSASAAEKSVKISGVHLCCKRCVIDAQKTLDKVSGILANISGESGSIILTAPDTDTLQKGADALVEAGYFGKSSDSSITLNPSTGAKDGKVKALTVSGTHLCCDKCVKAVERAVKSVPGVEADNATKGAKSFEITGDFEPKEVFTALQKEGLTGKAGK